MLLKFLHIIGYFAFLPSPEPTYSKIYNGEWLDDVKPYHVIHRIASYPDVHGIFSDIMDFCFSHDANIRIDTHKDNRIMQHNIQKHGFSYCGIIYLANGDERLAYQKLNTEPVLHQKSFQELTLDELYELLRVRSEVFVIEQDCVYQDMVYYCHSYHFPGGHTPTAEEVHRYYVPLIEKLMKEFGTCPVFIR